MIKHHVHLADLVNRDQIAADHNEIIAVSDLGKRSQVDDDVLAQSDITIGAGDFDVRAIVVRHEAVLLNPIDRQQVTIDPCNRPILWQTQIGVFVARARFFKVINQPQDLDYKL